MEKEKNIVMQQIMKGAGILLVGAIISNLLAFVFQTVAARYLGTEQYGLLALGIMTMSITAQIAKAGLDVGIKRFTAIYLSKKDSSRLKGTLIAGFAFITLASIILSTIIYLGSEFLSIRIFNTEALIPIIKVFSVGIIFFSMISVFNEVFLAFKKPLVKVFIDTILDKALRLVVLIALSFYGASLFQISISYVAVFVFATLIASIILKRSLNIKTAKPKYELQKLLVFSSSLFLAVNIALIMRWSDTIIISHFINSSNVGIYSIAYSLASILTIFIVSLAGMYFPIFAELFAKKKQKMMEGTYLSIAKISFLLTLPFFVYTVTFSEKILIEIFGNDFSTGSASLIILSSAFFIAATLGPFNPVLQVLGETKYILKIQIVLVGINFILNIILVRQYGIVGAAIATFITYVTSCVLYVTKIRQYLNLRPQLTKYLKGAVCAIIPATISWYIFIHYNLKGIINLIILGVAFFFAYCFLLLIFKVFDTEDKKIFIAIEKKFGLKKSIFQILIRT